MAGIGTVSFEEGVSVNERDSEAKNVAEVPRVLLQSPFAVCYRF